MKFLLNPKTKFIFSMLVFGTLGLFVRIIPLSSGEISLYRAVLAVLLIFIGFLIGKKKISFLKIKKEIPYLLLSGVAVAFNWILLFEAYRYTTVSVATLSYYFAPVLVTIVCPILFKEKLTVKGVICFVMATLGIVLITGVGDTSLGSNHLLGIAFGLGAAVFYAIAILTNKFIKNVDGLERTFLQFLVAIIVLIPYVLFTSGFNLQLLNGTSWVMLLIVGIVHTGFTYLLYFSSLKELTGEKIAILCYIDPLVAVIISVTILSEPLTIMQLIGGLLILGFTLWNELSPKRKNKN